MKRDNDILLELRNVRLSYTLRGAMLKTSTHEVLDGINVNVRHGETLGIIGRNGCGKSSLLRIMAGIIAPSAGEVMLKPSVSRAVLALGLGFRVELTGRDNAYLSSILQGNSRAQARSFLKVIKEFSELGDAFEKPVRTYSAGMRARLGFSTALISHVDILLIDEVLSVGDGHFRKKAGEAIRDKIKSDQTVVFVSHSGPEIRKLCDRLVWLEQGKIRLEGEVAETLNAYEATL